MNIETRYILCYTLFHKESDSDWIYLMEKTLSIRGTRLDSGADPPL